MLHTVMFSLHKIDLDSLLSLLKVGDVLLLLQDGVTAAVTGHQYLSSLLNTQVLIYVLDVDVKARGLEKWLDKRIKLINYEDFVHLTVIHQQQICWSYK